MAPITALPSELFLESILPNISRHDLCSLALTCKNLRDIAQTTLYQSIDIRWSFTIGSKSPPVHNLLKTLIRRPELALSTHHACFQTDYHPVDPRIGNTAPIDKRPGNELLLHDTNGLPNAQDLKLLKQTVVDAELPQVDDWIEALSKGSISASIALIVSRLLNVKTLEVSIVLQNRRRELYRTPKDPWGPSDSEPDFFGLMLRQTVLASPSAYITRFKGLEQVRLFTDIERVLGCPRIDLDQVLPIFYAPRLKVADVKIDDPIDAHRRQSPWSTGQPPRGSDMTSLRLHRSSVNELTLSAILPVFPNLTTFEFDYARTYDTIESGDKSITPGFDGTIIKEAIESCSSSLENLRISVQATQDSGPLRPHFDWWHRSCGDMRSFPVLRSLSISMVMLLGWYPNRLPRLADVLPRSLEKLCIEDDCQFQEIGWNDLRIIREFNHFFRTPWTAVTPKLKLVRLECPVAYYEWNEPQRRQFQELCSKEGLECEIWKHEMDSTESEREEEYEQRHDSSDGD
ncbi:uncharacterized protein K452DRAFT_363086 [Aplosporella prunicola CBS 121167]|uniref:F-box domain-containing protein n=1 Tax=Aplosporella prunicola CBS 121167 TaxID=1176127 RepID=A0A6A6AX64_9PEZI|nr:uncharacterized protein K452DRAFT_363086 [Aplosporella prunicola CBS 121167]KAF2135575.1 hypothetical protein K452DRAFT_363086 [Aplosporella prunicola CBS 121167]